MSISYGFYNSVNGDRKYSAVEMSKIFDGLINDGVYATVGDSFIVEAVNGLKITVGTGRAWFNHTWTYNDSKLPITCIQSEVLLDRIDALVLEVDEDKRVNSIKFVKGTPSQNPAKPNLINTDLIHQHPLCYIRRNANNDNVKQSDIENMIGTTNCPFVTGIIETINAEQLYLQWASKFEEFYESRDGEFDEWFDYMKDQLTTDAAGNLQTQIGILTKLSTSNKTDLVSAINEAYNRTPSLLATRNAVLNNTQPGKIADALVTRQNISNIDSLTTNYNLLNSEMTDLKKSVSDGKILVANAITSKGVPTAAGSTFAVMANNISKISTKTFGDGNSVIFLMRHFSEGNNHPYSKVSVDLTNYTTIKGIFYSIKAYSWTDSDGEEFTHNTVFEFNVDNLGYYVTEHNYTGMTWNYFNADQYHPQLTVDVSSLTGIHELSIYSHVVDSWEEGDYYYLGIQLI